MFNRAARLGEIVNRLSNRFIWATGQRTKVVETDVPIVSFTFDDVPDTALTAGAAILEKHGCRGTFYIAGSMAGTIEPERTLISAEGCRALAERGHEIGCHTFSHRAVRDLGGKALADDLDRNAAYLRQAAGIAALSNFAFPYNAAWPWARRTLRRRFRTCRAGGEAINRGPVDPIMLKGIGIEQPDAKARALTGVIDDAVATPGWLVFYTHDIAPLPTQYGCTPATFDRLVGYAIERDCLVLPVAAALDRLGW